jgi:uncharacterized protein YneR
VKIIQEEVIRMNEKIGSFYGISRKCVSVLCVLSLTMGSLLVIINAQAEMYSEDQYVFEAEEDYIIYDPSQKIYDPDASLEFAVAAFLDVLEEPNVFNYYLDIQSGGWFKYYVRARSDTCSSITVGWNGSLSAGDQNFKLTEDYRWYITEEFPAEDGEQISLWVHASRCTEYIDKFMLIRFKDNSQDWTGMNPGQIIDPNPLVNDTDGDDLNDSFEVNTNVWWFEAEHHEDPLNATEVDQDDASNSKGITPVQGPGGLIAMLDEFSFPPFPVGNQYKFFVRAKGTGMCAQIMLSVTQGGTNYIFRDTHDVTSDYRWFSTPTFVTIGMNPNLEIQVEVMPIYEGTTFIDKLMLVRDPLVNSLPGQISDPLDPDTDIDGCLDGEEIIYSASEGDSNSDIYWFEAEDCIFNPFYDFRNNPPWNPIGQVDTNEYLASNCRAVKPRAGDSKLIDSFLLPSYMGFSPPGYYKIFLRAKTKLAGLNDSLEIYVNGVTPLNKLNHFELTLDEYRWYISTGILSTSTATVDIIGASSSVRLDKIMMVYEGKFTPGQMTDPLDPDIDWDLAFDGRENNENVHWFEAEAHVYNANQIVEGVNRAMIPKRPDASNSTAIAPANIGGQWKLTDGITFPSVVAGYYQLYMRMKYDQLEGSPGEFTVTIDETTINNLLFMFLEEEYHWFVTPPFNHQAPGPMLIFIDTTAFSTRLDKLLIVRLNDSAGVPTDRGIGVGCSDPIDPDMDWDGRLDGREVNENLWWFEAENFKTGGNIVDLPETSNTKAVERNSPGEMFSITAELPVGGYKCYLRIKGSDELTTKIKLKTTYKGYTETNKLPLTTSFRWKFGIIDFEVDDDNIHTVTISGEHMESYGISPGPYGTASIDKIMLVRLFDEKFEWTRVPLGQIKGPTFWGIYNAAPGRVSHALDSDSDYDHINDGDEIKSQLINYGFGASWVRTDPMNRDTDNDRVWDCVEESVFGDSDTSTSTNPMKADTDYDMLPDGWVDGWRYDPLNHRYELGPADRDVDLGIQGEYIYLEGEDVDSDGAITEGGNLYFIETDPLSKDTDTEGLWDSVEYRMEIDPLDLDSDDDGLGDYYEWNNKLDPADWDFDNDLLSDGLEKGITTSTAIQPIKVDGDSDYDVYGTDTSSPNFTSDADNTTTTNPKAPDTDHDGLPDGWIDGWGYNVDTDKWGHYGPENDVKEYNVTVGNIIYCEYEDKNLDGKVNGNPYTETDPNDSDTDDGGIFDGIEANDQTDPLNSVSTTNDDDHVDSDGDGLWNGYENATGTIWNDSDSDDDGLNDGEEVGAGTNPMNPDSDGDGLMDGRPNQYVPSELNWDEDADEDGLINAMDPDSDEDGIMDNMEARVTFKTNVFDGNYANNTPGKWIAFDIDGDGDLDGFGRNESCQSALSGIYKATTPEGYHARQWKAGNYDKAFVNKSGEVNPPMYTNDQPETSYVDLSIYPHYLFHQTWYWKTDAYNPDSDGDGLLDGKEISIGTDPTKPDTDGDGWLDGFEHANKMDPLDPTSDTDGDKLTDDLEFIEGTDPLDEDTDGDRLPDGWEYTYGLLTSNWLDPNNEDTDGDGIRDDYETEDFIGGYFVDDELSNYWENKLGSLPISRDSDGDGWTDYQEYLEGTDPSPLTGGRSTPFDMDGDGLGPVQDPDDDGDTVSDTAETAAGTNPLDKDSDNDGLWDNEQSVHGTDPLDFDSDGDGLWDGEEINGIGLACGKNPDGTDHVSGNTASNWNSVRNTNPDNLKTDGNDEILWYYNGAGDFAQNKIFTREDHDGSYQETEEKDWAYVYDSTVDVTGSSVKWMTGDLDGNGKDEIIWYYNGGGSYSGKKIFVREDYNEAFEETNEIDWIYVYDSTVDVTSSSVKWMTGDLDGNGKDEIIWYYNGGGSYNGKKIFVREKYNGAYQETQELDWIYVDDSIVDVTSSSVKWMTGDLDGNGKDEIIWYYNGGGSYSGKKIFVREKYNTSYQETVEIDWIYTYDSTVDVTSSSVKWMTGDMDKNSKDEIIWYYNGGGPYSGNKVFVRENYNRAYQETAEVDWIFTDNSTIDVTGSGVKWMMANVDKITVDAGPSITAHTNIPINFPRAKITYDNTGEDPFTYKWNWDIFDSSNTLIAKLEGQYPVYSFSSSGTYTAKVTVSNGWEGHSDTLTVAVTLLTTDPTDPDDDTDDIWDGDEYFGRKESDDPDYPGNLRGYICDPAKDDTDGDKFKDKEEVDPNGVMNGIYENLNPFRQNWVGYFAARDIKSSIYTSLSNYCNNIEAYVNIYTHIFVMGTAISPSILKQWIHRNYNYGMIGAVFVGRAPIAYYDYDDTNEPHPNFSDEIHTSDLYYEDLDGDWDGGDGTLGDPFDSHSDGTGDASPEIWVGQLRPPTVDNSELITQLQAYFQRAISYMQTNMSGNPNGDKGLVFKVGSDYSNPGNLLSMDRAYSDVTDKNHENHNDTCNNDYISELTSNIYETLHEQCHGSATSAIVNSDTIEDINLQQNFYVLFSCHSADYTTTNYIAGMYAFSNPGSSSTRNPTATPRNLIAISSSKTGGILGENNIYDYINQPSQYMFGTAWLNWWKQYGMDDGNSDSEEAWFGGMTFVGDPSLRT